MLPDSTRALAKRLNVIEIVSTNVDQQPYDYFMVLDFESTCWDKREKYKFPPEIIEFSTCLYSVSAKQILAEFQQYVMPFEQPKLSDFCRKLTGIEQAQVDHGVPIQTCLMLFAQWIHEQATKYNFSDFLFITWTDWDLGTCLNNELRRKRLKKHAMFEHWCNAKQIFKDEFKSMPKNLLEALKHFGLAFEGRQHCGLDDARNTAYLVREMLAKGAIFKITASNKCI